MAAGNLVDYIIKTSPRNQVKRDDILDALAAVVTAASGLQNLLTLPENPDSELHSKGNNIISPFLGAG